LTLGVEFPFVRLEPYSPAWAQEYAVERERLESALGDRAVGIEHVGSTSVRGLSAKPIIDIVVGLRDLNVAEQLVASMCGIGYDDAGDGGVPNHRIFGRGRRLRTHLVHMVVANSAEWRSHIGFRNALRNDRRLVEAYSALKVELAAKFPKDRPSYTREKSRFIEDVLHGAA
jgi:GrpB-like predicted nucleotidyltransferase (UPF0157 family)